MGARQPIRALNDPVYLALVETYRERPIVLYTGAGASSASDKRYGLQGWNALIESILGRQEPQPAALGALRQAAETWSDEPWQLAQWVAQRIGLEAFERHLVAIVQGDANFQSRYKLLSGHFLSNAPTLNALCALCARFVGVVRWENGFSYRVAPNPRVRAVITSNYDPFMEAASSLMYRKPTLKPVVAATSSAGELDQIPVFHVHGYVPFPSHDQGGAWVPQLLADLVITRDDYERAWCEEDAYCLTMGPQIQWLRHHTALFVGFSFRDPWVRRLLRHLRAERDQRYGAAPGQHYAFMHRDEIESRDQGFFAELGVNPIALDCFRETPTLLGHLYRRGLERDYAGEEIELPILASRSRRRTGAHVSLTGEQYWRDLNVCRLCRARGSRLAPSDRGPRMMITEDAAQPEDEA